MRNAIKNTVPVFILTLFIAVTVSAQDQYKVLVERPNEKSLVGIISRDALVKDTSFKWYADNQKIYTPNTYAVDALRQNKDSVQLVVFMGTWCEDSHFIIPRLHALTDAAGFPADRISLIGVDRNKKTLGYLCEALDVKNVPTIIVMKKGKEKGRVVEYGSSGMFDKELGQILNSAN